MYYNWQRDSNVLLELFFYFFFFGIFTLEFTLVSESSRFEDNSSQEWQIFKILLRSFRAARPDSPFVSSKFSTDLKEHRRQMYPSRLDPGQCRVHVPSRIKSKKKKKKTATSRVLHVEWFRLSPCRTEYLWPRQRSRGRNYKRCNYWMMHRHV